MKLLMVHDLIGLLEHDLFGLLVHDLSELLVHDLSGLLVDHGLRVDSLLRDAHGPRRFISTILEDAPEGVHIKGEPGRVERDNEEPIPTVLNF